MGGRNTGIIRQGSTRQPSVLGDLQERVLFLRAWRAGLIWAALLRVEKRGISAVLRAYTSQGGLVPLQWEADEYIA